MSELEKTFAKNLRRLRGAETQAGFAKKIGISQPSLNLIERGEQGVSLCTVDKVCRRLKVGVVEVLT